MNQNINALVDPFDQQQQMSVATAGANDNEDNPWHCQYIPDFLGNSLTNCERKPDPVLTNSDTYILGALALSLGVIYFVFIK